MSKVAFLMVTCCLEGSRFDVLTQVVDSLAAVAPALRDDLVVFDNASTFVGTDALLRRASARVYRSSVNVGYWTAVDWWLRGLGREPPDYVYVIESDMVHYGFDAVWECARLLDRRPDVGSVRLHRYSVAERHLYDKDRPVPGSKRGSWQSHTNRVTGEQVTLQHVDGRLWVSNFLTQVPALNRYTTMRDIFEGLAGAARFSELDFQAAYWDRYRLTGVLDGGIFHCDLNAPGAGGITGSWTDPATLAVLGYTTTRTASIVSPDGYTVHQVH